MNYDLLVGNPFIPAEDDIVGPVVADPDVADLTAAHFGSLTINGQDIATLALAQERGELLPTTLRGRPPTNTGEIGLGAEVSRRLHVGIGDDVHAVGPTGSAMDLRVVGIVVTPNVAGNGAVTTFEDYRGAHSDRDEERALDQSP